MSQTTMLPRSRREWLEYADQSAPVNIAGSFQPDGSGFAAAMVTWGPKFYVRRVFERYAQEHGYVVTNVRRQKRIPNPITGEMNTLYSIQFEPRQ